MKQGKPGHELLKRLQIHRCLLYDSLCFLFILLYLSMHMSDMSQNEKVFTRKLFKSFQSTEYI
jgi:hypothetical protein